MVIETILSYISNSNDNDCNTIYRIQTNLHSPIFPDSAAGFPPPPQKPNNATHNSQLAFSLNRTHRERERRS